MFSSNYIETLLSILGEFFVHIFFVHFHWLYASSEMRRYKFLFFECVYITSVFFFSLSIRTLEMDVAEKNPIRMSRKAFDEIYNSRAHRAIVLWAGSNPKLLPNLFSHFTCSNDSAFDFFFYAFHVENFDMLLSHLMAAPNIRTKLIRNGGCTLQVYRKSLKLM